MKIEVEVDSLAQLDEALAEAPDVIMLDNFSLADLRRRRGAGRRAGWCWKPPAA